MPSTNAVVFNNEFVKIFISTALLFFLYSMKRMNTPITDQARNSNQQTYFLKEQITMKVKIGTEANDMAISFFFIEKIKGKCRGSSILEGKQCIQK